MDRGKFEPESEAKTRTLQTPKGRGTRRIKGLRLPHPPLDAERGQALKMLFIALRAMLFSAGFILLWGWVALSLHHRYDTALGFTFSDWTPALGIALMAAGGTLAFACIATFVIRGEGTPAPMDPPRKFVAAGPYQFVRNPMYIGGFLVLAASASTNSRSPFCSLPCHGFYSRISLSSSTKSRISAPHLARPTKHIVARCTAGCLSASRFAKCPIIRLHVHLHRNSLNERKLADVTLQGLSTKCRDWSVWTRASRLTVSGPERTNNRR